MRFDGCINCDHLPGSLSILTLTLPHGLIAIVCDTSGKTSFITMNEYKVLVLNQAHRYCRI